jgi:hypothetical protein
LFATFDFTAGATASSATVIATLGATTQMSTIEITAAPMGGLVINEIDYDQVGTDNAEYVEIYNASTAPIDLTHYALVLLNGSSTPAATYLTFPLGGGGTLMPGQYLVVATTTVTSPAGVARLNFALAQDNVQNGAPDGIALINTVTHTLVDALSYEGAITAATITGFTGPVSLVEGTVLPTATADSNTTVGALCRMPNGSDTNNAATDWTFCTMLTPGAANAL